MPEMPPAPSSATLDLTGLILTKRMAMRARVALSVAKSPQAHRVPGGWRRARLWSLRPRRMAQRILGMVTCGLVESVQRNIRWGAERLARKVAK